MTALEYMEKQVEKHRADFQQAALQNASEAQLQNIRQRIWHYQEAVEALRMANILLNEEDEEEWE